MTQSKYEQTLLSVHLEPPGKLMKSGFYGTEKQASAHNTDDLCTSKPSFQSSSIGRIEPLIVYSSNNFSLFPAASWCLQNGRTSKG